MKDILEKLYFGVLNPSKGNCEKNIRYRKYLNRVCTIEQDLINKLNDEQKEMFHEYSNIQMKLTSEENFENFICGFRLGSKIIIEIMLNDEDALYDLK